MTELLDRLRIPYADVLVYSEAELEPSDHTVGRFRHFIGSFLSKSEAVASRSAKLTKGDLAKFEAMVCYGLSHGYYIVIFIFGNNVYRPAGT